MSTILPVTVSSFARVGAASAKTNAAIESPVSALRMTCSFEDKQTRKSILPASPMRQVVITRYGTPEVLQVRETPDLAPRDGEVRIAVHAAGVNFADVMARLGLSPPP